METTTEYQVNGNGHKQGELMLAEMPEDNSHVQKVHIAALRPHPLNSSIYGITEDVHILVDDIQQSQWIKPLIVNQDYQIISGHRRWKAAQMLAQADPQWLEVPVEVARFNDEQHQIEVLLLENRYRQKTPEQQVREAQAWKDIEVQKALKRKQAAALETNAKFGTKINAILSTEEITLVENFPQALLSTEEIKEVEKTPVQSKKEEKINQRTEEGNTRKALADRVGMGTGRTLEKAEAVVQKADELRGQGNQVAADGLLKVLNTQSVDGAHKLVKEQRNGGDITPVLEKVATGEAKTVKEAKKAVKEERKQEVIELPVHDRYQLFEGDLLMAGAAIADNSIDYIITDPPYPKEFLEVFGKLGILAARVLKPGGSLIAMTGQSYMSEILISLSSHLNYHWMIAYLTPGGQAVQLWQKNVNTFWKPLLWFTKGKYTGDWVSDTCQSKPNDNDKNHHHWGQSESGMASIIEKFTYPGITILDPFCGGGTTGVVAITLSRNFIGIDIDPTAIATTKTRLAKVLQNEHSTGRSQA